MDRTTHGLTATVELVAGPPAYGGLSVSRVDGRVVFVKGAIPGEAVLARVDEAKKDYSTATAIEIIGPSPDRVEPPCRHFGVCGGCHIQYASYDRQVRMKEEALAGVLRRMAKVEPPFLPSLTGSPFGYRQRARFKAAPGRLGFFRERSHTVVDIESCPLMSDATDTGYRAARETLRGSAFRELQITCGDGALALVRADGDGGGWDEAAARLIASGFAGVSVDAGGGRVLSYGAGYVSLDLCGLDYTISPASFIQANWALNRGLVATLMDSLRPLSGLRVLDLYSGAGNFAMPAALHAGEVVAVEENPGAVADGIRNAGLNDIENCRFVQSGAGAPDVAGPFDVVIADPPRTGLDPVAVDYILGAGLGRMAYVSCDPATLARDLKKLSVKYDVESVRMVDFFPQTYHIEAVAMLVLR